MVESETIVALSSGRLPAGIAVVRISGPKTRFVLETITGSVPEPRFARYGAFADRAGSHIDSGIALFFQAPASFTGEDSAELHAHGGKAVVAALLDAGGLDPTVINGGIINAYGTNARLGRGDWMVVESDESDGTFVKLPADVVIVTNIDPEHLDHYGTFDAARQAYLAFVENIPFYGFAVMCLDHPEVQALIGRVRDRQIITYGRSPQADARLTDLEYRDGESRFSVVLSRRRETPLHPHRLP